MSSGSQNQIASKAYAASTFTCWSIWLIHASIFVMLFSLEKVVFRLWFKKNYTWPHPYYMHNQMISTCILRIINSPQSIFSISLPCQLPNPFPVSWLQTLITSLGCMLNQIQRVFAIFFQVVQMFWFPPHPTPLANKDQWLCTCGVRTAPAMFSLLECLQTRIPEF